MVRNYFPSLVVQNKWRTKHRNVKVGDIVLIQDSEVFRGEWRMGKVIKAIEGTDGIVRNCEVQYKVKGEDDKVNKRPRTILRPVQRLVIVVAVDE